ncbi:YceI family protein [Olivibacter domesticus]|uniref:Polyisoprenoid-binding protein YceI n=1 Tax=Olivibacter domesticus TaxID=407022 RepID=A0A1H7Z9A5_OLID1|nr:YceI family protein [Olivibacter domesticus]SEM54118.1 Polyisoprenoid-binding protein YceI [Olivibacter domesticus]
MVNWKIDTKHSEIHFKVKHMLISTVTGLFTKFDGTVSTEKINEFEGGKVSVEIETNSVYTNEEYRDNHLKSDAFFDIEKFPIITFESMSLNPQRKNEFLLKGILTIKQIAREVELKVIFGGAIESKEQYKAGFRVTGKISRKDFGLIYNPLMEAGGLVVSEEVKIIGNVQLIKI